MVSDYRAIFPRFWGFCLETARTQWCDFAEMVCKCVALKNGGLRVLLVQKGTVWADVLGASQQGFSYALGPQERVDDLIGINLPLTGSWAHSVAFFISIIHLMSISIYNSKLCIDKKKSFSFIVFVEQVEVLFVQVLHSALDVRLPSANWPKKKKRKFLLFSF